MQTLESVAALVRKTEENYTSGSTTISKYVEFDMYENINKIEAYINSKHISGDTDSLGREKPFFNISVAVRNIWYRATQMLVQYIGLKSSKSTHYMMTFLAKILLQQWMRKALFGKFLAKWDLTLATYGSAVSKFITKNGELHCNVVPWNRLICDAINFEDNIKIEVLEMTPAQLRKSKYDQEQVQRLIDSLSAREDLNKEKRDNKADYIKLYEVHGELPLSYLTEKEEDDDKYVQQMHVVSFIETKGEYEDFTLYKGKETKDPYMISHLIEEDGRTMAMGAVEYAFEAQWMTNHSQKLIKDTLDLTSLLILQTSDSSFAGRNALSSLVTGDIQVHAPESPITQLNNQHDLTGLFTFQSQWMTLNKENTSTTDAMRGNTQPSGTAYRLQQLITNQSESLFETMRDNKELEVERMLRTYILPHLKTKMDTREEVAALLDAQGIQEFDSMFVPNEAIKRGNKKMKDAILNEQVADQADFQAIEQDVKTELSPLGNNRYIRPSDIDNKTWKEELKDFEWEPLVRAKKNDPQTDATLETLSSLFHDIANPATQAVLQTPQGKFLFNKILEESRVVSPLEFAQINNQPPPQPAPVAVQPQQLTQPK